MLDLLINWLIKLWKGPSIYFPRYCYLSLISYLSLCSKKEKEKEKAEKQLACRNFFVADKNKNSFMPENSLMIKYTQSYTLVMYTFFFSFQRMDKMKRAACSPSNTVRGRPREPMKEQRRPFHINKVVHSIISQSNRF